MDFWIQIHLDTSLVNFLGRGSVPWLPKSASISVQPAIKFATLLVLEQLAWRTKTGSPALLFP